MTAEIEAYYNVDTCYPISDLKGFKDPLFVLAAKYWDSECRVTWLGTTPETDEDVIKQRRRSCFGDTGTGQFREACPFLVEDEGEFFCGANNEGTTEVNKLTKLTIAGVYCPRKAPGFANNPYYVANGVVHTQPSDSNSSVGGGIIAGPEWTGETGAS